MTLDGITRLKLALGVIGIGLFLWGMRSDMPGLRWAGIVVLGGAFAVRYVRPREGPPEPP